jgi:hypothetical protein
VLEDLTLPTLVRPCKVRNVKTGLDDADVKRLDNLIESPDWPIKTLERALAEKGILLSESVIRKHRMKSCGCFER